RHPVAEFGGAVVQAGQGEPAQHRAVLGDEQGVGAGTGLLLGQQGVVPLGELVLELIAPVGDRGGEGRAGPPPERQHPGGLGGAGAKASAGGAWPARRRCNSGTARLYRAGALRKGTTLASEHGRGTLTGLRCEYRWEAPVRPEPGAQAAAAGLRASRADRERV